MLVDSVCSIVGMLLGLFERLDCCKFGKPDGSNVRKNDGFVDGDFEGRDDCIPVGSRDCLVSMVLVLLGAVVL